MFQFLCFVNIFQTVYPRVADTWLANFESQLQGCVQHPGQREGLKVGEILPLAEHQELQRGAVRDVQDPSQELVHGVQELRQGVVRDVQEPSQDLVNGVQDLRQGAVCGVQDLHQGSTQLLHDGVARVVQDGPHETQVQSFVNFLSSEELPCEVQMNVKSRTRDLTLSEKVLLHKDSAVLGLNFEEELAARSLPVEVKMPEVVHLDILTHPLEP